MKVAVIGTGYVGLVAGACMAETGNDVICVDIDKDRIKKLKSGVIPIYEPGLKDLVERNAGMKRLTFITNTVEAVEKSLVIFLAVPTPMDENGAADLQHFLKASGTVARGINGYKVIVDKSTVPVGTASKVMELISGLTDHPFDVVSNPEFLKEGAAVDDFMKPDRVVIGCNSKRASDIITELYAPFVRTGHPMLRMSLESAELTKYAANAFLATKISFINEIARLCEKVGANVTEVRQGIGTDSRIGSAFLHPGIGFGGSCFPKDLQALIFTSQTNDIDLKVIKAVVVANERQKQFMPQKIKRQFGDKLKGSNFGLWGLAFKANTDDMRESPALNIIDFLLEEGANVKAYDPQAMGNAKRLYGSRISFCRNSFEAVKGADALVIATEWNEFRHPDFDRMRKLMKGNIIFDGRNLFNPTQMKKLGFTYYGIGQPS